MPVLRAHVPRLLALAILVVACAAPLLAPGAAPAAGLRGPDLRLPKGARTIGAGSHRHLLLSGRRAASAHLRTGALTGIAVTARGARCRRAPVLSVRVDRGRIHRTRVRRAWRTYRWRLRARAGRHRVAVVLANPGGVRRRCARRLVVGRIALAERGRRPGSVRRGEKPSTPAASPPTRRPTPRPPRWSAR